MASPRIAGYVYEGDYHCDGCAVARFGRCSCPEQDVHGEDADGNDVGALFEMDAAGDETCGDCGAELG